MSVATAPPARFRYSVKVNRLIAHEKRMVHPRMLVEEFCAIDLIRASDVIYARLHGRSRSYRQDYTPEELGEWARKSPSAAWR